MSHHKCTKQLYKAFLEVSSQRYTGKALSEVSPTIISHDSVSRFLKTQSLSPKEVWKKSTSMIDKKAKCLLIADDTVLSKKYSKKIDLVNFQYSGNEHDVIAGIGLVNLLWYDLDKQENLPIDYRVYDKATDGKTKNTHLCEMISLAKKRGITPEAVVMDAWYSSLKNLKSIRDHGFIWVTTLRKNRKVNKNETLENINIDDNGTVVHLRGYGRITVFKFVAKNGRIDYVATNMKDPELQYIVAIVKARWSIEVYHRELKQTCGIERCQARNSRAQRNHICFAILAWIDKYRRRINYDISLYQQDWNIIKSSITNGIKLILNCS